MIHTKCFMSGDPYKGAEHRWPQMLLYGHWWLRIPNPQHLCHNIVYDIDGDGICHVEKLLMLTAKNTHLFHWSFVRGTHWPQEDFHPELAIMRKPFPCHDCVVWIFNIMMTSSNGNIFHVTGHLCGEFTGHRWIPRTKASDTELWCFLWSMP